MPGKLTAANIVDRAAKKFGDKPFVYREAPVYYEHLGYSPDDEYVTFDKALESTNIIASAMKEMGVKRGDRIAVVLTNLPETGIIFTAAARLGAIIVPFNYMLKAEELTRAVQDCGAKVCITEPDLFKLNIRDKANVPGIEHWVMTGTRDTVPEGFLSIDEITEGHRGKEVEPVDLSPDDTVAIFYTSGTTGFPKGAMLSSRNLLSTTTLSIRMLRIGTKDFGVTALPLAHIFGFNTSIIGGFYSGCSGFLLRFFDPVKVLETMEKHKATIIMGVPAMFNFLLLSGAEKYDMSSMRYWICGADAMAVENIKRLEALGGRFIEGYGLVETAPIISVNPYFARRPGTVGLPIPRVKVKVMDEEGKMVRRGKVGEFVVRGPNVMKGYWGDEERTRQAFEHGWFHTGDIGFRDRIGYLHFVDREKDVVKHGGYSVFSCEVEEEILQNPKVQEVALIGKPHPNKGEVPVAFVQLIPGETATEDEILAWCTERIAKYKAPQEVRIIDEMPMTMTLKVLKRELRRILEEEQHSEKKEEPEAR